MSGTREVVTLAEDAVNLAKLRLIAQTLVAAALSSPAADLLAIGFPAGAEVHAADLALLTLTAGAQVARLTVTSPTVISTCEGKSYSILLADYEYRCMTSRSLYNLLCRVIQPHLQYQILFLA